jgi:glycosyltransferase involved in cell wall biosynthesis
MLGQLAEDLSRTHEVMVVAGRPSYNVGATDYCPRGVVVSRVRSTSFSHRTLAGRVCNYLSFALLALVSACRMPRPDVVVAMTNPPFIGLIGSAAAARFGAPFVLTCHDIYPDIAVAMGWLRNRWVAWGWRRVNGVVRTRAARVIVVGRDMAERLISQGVHPAKLVYIPAWAESQVLDEDARLALRTEHGWDGRFIVMHAGNVGLAQNVGLLADLATRVRDQPDIQIVVLGDGPAKPMLKRAVRDRGLDNVALLPTLPPRRAQQLMAAADLHVVSLVPGLWGCAAPSKTYGIMAAARPFVAAVDPGSEPARLAEEHGCGRWVSAGDADALAAAVLDLRTAPLDAMGERGRRAFHQQFRREHVTAENAEVLEAVAGHS